MADGNLHSLCRRHPVPGELIWIGVRPGRKQTMEAIESVFADLERGLAGDHYAGRSKKRQVTLMQWEHLAVLESLLGKTVTPDLLRRNLLVRGINLLSLKGQCFRIGEAVFRASGPCHPCSRMESALGPGGFNAMRGHGGITAQVTVSGSLRIGDSVIVVEE